MGSEEGMNPASSDIIQTLIENRNRFRAYLSRHLGNEAVAEEILQQALLKAIENEKEIQNEESLVPWFYRVLRNALIDHYRASATDQKKTEAFLREIEASGSDKSQAADNELKKAVCQCFEGLLPTLRPGYSDLVRKIDLEGKAPEAVAKELGISTNNLWVRLHRARQALRKSLERSCGACSKHACLDCTCRH